MVVRAREEAMGLPGGAHTYLEKGIPAVVVTSDPLPTDPAGDGVVTQAITDHPMEKTWRPRRYLAAATNSDLRRWRLRDLLGSAQSQSPAPSLARHLSIANSLTSTLSCRRRVAELASTREDRLFWEEEVT